MNCIIRLCLKRIPKFNYLAFVKMAQNARCENELGTVSDKCRSTISDEDNVSDFLPMSKNVRKSSGRRSFSNRRSLCFDSLGVYCSYSI